jgi:hypothetical protein
MVSVRDIIIISILLLVVGIAITVTVYASHIVNNAFVTTPTISNNTQAVQVISASDSAINYSDYLYFVGFLAFFIAVVITGYFASTHPVFSVIYFVIVILFTFFSVILQYVWSQLASDPFFIASLVNLPITNYILSHLAYFTAVFGLVGILLMFAKRSDGGGYSG